MKKEKLLEIEKLLSALENWPLNKATMDAFVIHNLDILSVITEDYETVKTIASDLSLIVRARQGTEKYLRKQLLDIENSLEEDLRGFCSLLDMVLEANTIRPNTCELLESLSFKYQFFVGHFSYLVRYIDALMDLEIAFEICRPRVFSLLFLINLEEIIAGILSRPRQEVRAFIIDWLSKRNNYLAAIFQTDIDFLELFSILRHCQSEQIGWEEILLAFLASASIKEMVLPAHSFVMLDGMLLRMGLEGLMPLLESGFVSIEGFSKNENTAKIFCMI